MYQEYVGCVLDSMILLFVEDKQIHVLVVFKAVRLLWFLTVLAVCVYTLVHLLC